MNKVVLGVFGDYNAASDAVRDLREGGFPANQISLIGENTDEMRPVASHLIKAGPDKMMTVFSIAGAIGGFLVGLSTVAIPGTGDLVLAGPGMAAVAGAAAGGYLGLITGALVHFDVPEYEAKIYQGQLSAGKVVLALQTKGPEGRFKAEEIMDHCGALEVDTRAA